MSSSRTAAMLAVYVQQAMLPTGFFTGMFQVRPENIYDTEEVEIDIQRAGEEVAVTVYDVSAGYRMNADDLYTNKAFKPPVYKEAWTVNAFSLLKRQPGDNPFQNRDFRAKLTRRIFSGMVKIDEKIRRAIELQASQVMQTGKITLTDLNGLPSFELDFKPKSSHFPTASVAWDAAGADPIGDLENLCNQIRNDSGYRPDQVIMGSAALNAFLSNTAVLERFDNRRIDLGTVSSVPNRGQDAAQYRGTIDVGSYKLDLWTYGGFYRDPQTNAVKEYLDPANVVVRASMGRLDATFGAIPNIGEILGVGPRQSLLPELPPRMSSVADGLDFHVNAWLDERGEAMFAGLGARPLMIPTAIDSFGCLDTGL